MAAGSPARIRRILMGWVTLTFVLAWLPLVRSLMDGISYEWGTRYFGISFSGAGLSGDLWLLVLLTALGIWLVYRGWRDPSPPFSAILLAWLGLLTANSLYSVITAPELYSFEGATLGVSVPLATVAPVLHVAAFGLALLWNVRQRGSTEVKAHPEWTSTNTALTGLVLVLFPVQFLLLRSGQGQEARDVVGVLLTIFQWLLVSAALYPWDQRRSAQAARPVADRTPA